MISFSFFFDSALKTFAEMRYSTGFEFTVCISLLLF